LSEKTIAAVLLPEQEESPRGFNWGAFLFTWIWALGNRSFNVLTLILLLLCLIPYVGVGAAIGLAIYSGATGNRRAWNNKRWQNRDHFLVVQRHWRVAGLAQIAVALVFFIFIASIAKR
jgi:hypothetical protein